MSFSELFTAQLNNPECSILSGMLVGEFFIVKWLFGLFLAIMIFQIVNKLAWIPFINWLETKIYRRLKK